MHRVKSQNMTLYKTTYDTQDFGVNDVTVFVQKKPTWGLTWLKE